ncbi:MAG: NADH-quinone oxidoreductase subunit C [Gaiella sp.]|nr:NADH-quinone oxidoreductase subunit C [Gaiella sp.]
MTLHDARGYRDAVESALADGCRFAGLHASAGGAVVHAALLDPDGTMRLESVRTEESTAPTLVDVAPAANWDEREAHDLYGVRFDGHEPLRPLVDHDLALSHWTVPMRGDDAYQVVVGPIHAGVIESGHFRFHVVGDRILHLDARLFYKHRGLERAAEGHTLAEGARYVGRACAACSVANGLAYAHACEESLGLESPSELARARTLLLELERVWSHLNDIAAVCAGVGLAAGNNLFAALTERARRLNADLTGHRFLFGGVAVGGSSLDLDAHAVGDAREELEAIGREAARGWRELQFSASFQDRLPNIGVVSRDDVDRLGTVGPSARAAGVAIDVRSVSPLLDYAGFECRLPDRPDGDVRARLEQRALELEQSIEVALPLLDGPVRPVAAAPGAAESTIGVGLVESARGATLCVVERDADRLRRVRLRTGSYANWPSVAYAATDNLLPDFPLINKSFELCYACADR